MRLSIETLDYLKNVIRKTEARTLCDAIRLIIIERELRDKERGEIAQFDYIPGPTKRNRRKSTPEAVTTASEDAPHIGDPLTPPLREKDPTPTRDHKTPFGGMNKQIYPGTREEYEKLLKNGEILEGMFIPPDN